MLSKKKSFLENVSLIFGCLGQVKNYPSTEKKKKKLNEQQIYCTRENDLYLSRDPSALLPFHVATCTSASKLFIYF
jgi:hypothetical protein